MVDTKRLKAAIITAGYTQRTLANVLGISKNTLNSKVNGRADFYVDEVIRICDVLGIRSDTDKCSIFLS